MLEWLPRQFNKADTREGSSSKEWRPAKGFTGTMLAGCSLRSKHQHTRKRNSKIGQIQKVAQTERPICFKPSPITNWRHESDSDRGSNQAKL